MKYCEDNQCTIVSGNKTEAIADVDHYEKDSHVSIPSLEAVEIAKQWVEDNEK